MRIRNFILKNKLGIVFKNKKFSELTTIKVGGKIKNLYYPITISDLLEVLKYLNKINKDYFILGNGSNLVVSDNKFNDLVISGKHLIKQIEFYDDSFVVSGFMDLRLVISKLIEKNISTFTKLTGIPATIGGAIYMNAGVSDYNISNDLIWVKYIYENEIIKAGKEELYFDYRDSYFKGKKIVIIEACFKTIYDGNTNELYKEILKNRKDIQPLNYPNCGSIFRNTKDYKAYEVIRRINLVDCMMGGAKFSEKHANFIVNVNKAKAIDVFRLIEYAKFKAKSMLEIELKEEVILLNFNKKYHKYNYGKNKK